jgi:4-hydroxybenzoyl-CoA thioesterase/acyl-CoA thioester hydrolase
MTASYHTARRVEFSDTDAAGIMHFTAYVRVMESAEHELLRDLGLTVFHREQRSLLSWPRVSLRCDFHKPAYFEDLLDVEVWIGELAERSVTYRFEIRRRGERLASGEMASVCCRIDEDGRITSVSIPAEITAKLRTRMR